MENWPRKLTEIDYQDAEEWMGIYRGKPNQVLTRFALKFPKSFESPKDDDEKFAYLAFST